MTKLKEILTDGVILFAISTGFVLVVDRGFSTLKGKVKQDDPIVTAIIQADSEKLAEGVKKGGSVTNETDELGRAALMRAAYANYSNPKTIEETDAKRVAMVELLVKQGAQLDTLDNDGWSALMWASWSGLTQVASKLLDLGASHQFADRQGNTALIIAAQRGNAGIVRALLAKGADRAVSNKAGKSALDAANSGLEQYPDKRPAYGEVLAALR
jgi:ankyrin repeat protein